MCAETALAPPEIRLPLAPDCRAVEVQALFRGRLIASRCLHLDRRKAARFVIGSAKGVDAPTAEESLGETRHALVRPDPDGFAVALAGTMTGRAMLEDRSITLDDLVRDDDGRLIAPPAARLELACGEVTFIVNRTALPPIVPRPPPFRRDLRGPTAAAAAATLAFVALMAFVPRDPKALSFDLLIATHRFVAATVFPKVQPVAPLGPSALGAPGADPLPLAAPVTRKARHLGPAAAAAQPHGAGPREMDHTGILGILSASDGQSWRTIFSAHSPLSATAQDSLRGLQAIDMGAAAGQGGLTLGAGPGGSGGYGLQGSGSAGLSLGAIGGCDARCRAAQRLGPHGPAGLTSRSLAAVDLATAPVVVRGVLDREIVRRVIRRHLNEIRYCYERELPRHPELAGRVVVTFTITPQGRVMTAAQESSTMNDGAVESCVVQAVRRWDFPQPKDNGVVIVSYPFVFVPAGS